MSSDSWVNKTGAQVVNLNLSVGLDGKVRGQVSFVANTFEEAVELLKPFAQLPVLKVEIAKDQIAKVPFVGPYPQQDPRLSGGVDTHGKAQTLDYRGIG